MFIYKIKDFMKNKIYTGIICLGTDGNSVIKILHNIKDIIKTKTGEDIIIKTIITRTIPKIINFDFPFNINIISTNIDDILIDNKIDIFVELIGGYESAKNLYIKSFKRKTCSSK